MNSALVIALTIWGEAQGEPLTNKIAVASVIYNRAGGRPEQMATVCLAPKQFSCWNNGTPKGPQRNNKIEQRAYAECVGIASAMMSGKFVPTTAAIYYHDDSVRKPPYWTKGRTMVLHEGALRFYV